MQKKIIIFDMDGVLVDTIPNARKAFLARHTGVTSDMYDEIHTGNYHTEAEKYAHLHIKETEAEKERREADYIQLKSNSTLFPGAKDLLKKLHESGYTLALNTNASNDTCLPLLENLEIKDFFDFIATAELSKDKVLKFELIGEKYATPTQDILFISDALGDIRDAAIVGMPTIAVTWGVHNKSYFQREKHEHLIGIVDTTEDLFNLIEK